VVAGAILLVFLAVLVAFGWTRARRRLGMGVTGRHYVVVIVVFCLVVLAMWAAATHG
jgi:fumarate reductase subunit D